MSRTRFFQNALNLLPPDRCLLCLLALQDARSDYLCEHCRMALPLNVHSCWRCALPLPGLEQTPKDVVCGGCRVAPLADRAIAPLTYTPLSARLIQRCKFGHGQREAICLSQLIATAIVLGYPEGLPELIIPVPTSFLNHLRRGGNPCHLLAKPLAARFKLPVVANLVRRKHSAPQRKKTRRQRLNLPGNTFTLRKTWLIGGTLAHEIQGRNVVVIDDVITKGTTARHMIRLLRGAGASRVDLWAAARAETSGP